ncbi:glycosyltransferase family 2 protein [Niabella pedocola]|uniref:Glycosyltransferase family 2 protein n=1 Tax=Niabella pedocola TaxID=1752077 RepID=A0ABS8PXE9_9BACT|nr:glycosyltransferase family 2 protein [Niabella pedocola]MCD2425575.1 glycosyltransferase family 2 protein [Niabella pedocola]
MDISVVIPLLNEEESLPELAEWIARVMQENHFSYEILFVDDGSTDDSWQVICSLREKNPNIRGIKFQRNYGKSAALNEAFRAAQGDVVITMDADLQDSPDEIPELFRMIREDRYDLVSGWKKVRYDNTVTKNIPSKFFNAVTRKVSKIQLNDFNCGLKAYNRKVIKSIEVYGEMHRYIPVLAKWAGFKKIGEKVVEHRKRKYGVSKFGWDRFINGFLDLLSITFVGKFSKRPMHFFGVWGMIFFMIGILSALYLIITKFISSDFSITNRPVFYISLVAIIIGVQLFMAGFIGELISRNAPSRNAYLIEAKTGLD